MITSWTKAATLGTFEGGDRVGVCIIYALKRVRSSLVRKIK